MKTARMLTHVALAFTLSASLSACKTGNTEVWKGEADERWQTVKSSIAIEMAEGHFAAGQLGLAEKTVRDQLNQDPDHPQLWLLAGRISLENSELETGYQRLAKAIEYGEELADYKQEEKAKPYYYQGIIDQRWQRYDSAKERYTLAFERDGENVAYFLARIEMMVQLEELDAATAELETKSTYFDQNPTIRALLGHVYRRQANHAKAATWFKQATMLAPEDQKLREEYARSLVAVQRYDEAARALRELTQTEYGSDRADLRRLLAESYVNSGKLREARNVYAELTTLDRNSVHDWAKFGELTYRLGDDAAALNAANRLINLAPDDHRGYLLAGMVWNKRDRLDRALSMFDRAAELSPNDTTPLILRGIALQKSDRPAAAADAYQQALDINPADTRAQRLLSSVTGGLR